jgi:hypothetical protein
MKTCEEGTFVIGSQDALASQAVEEQRLANAGWPAALVKAWVDEFNYAAKVDGLGVIRFSSAVDLGNGWVRLHVGDLASENTGLAFPFPRGVDVRVKDIRWVADAPEGS